MNVVKTLTISIAAYNVQDYIGKTLESLLKCKNASDLDVIVVNDGSSDETLRVAREFERLAPTIIRIVNKQNGGYGSTINTSIRLAQGYITGSLMGMIGSTLWNLINCWCFAGM